MRSSSAWDRYVFRPTETLVHGARLASDLASCVSARRYADAVVRAGEIESALVDAKDPAFPLAMATTDALAARLVGDASDAARLTSDLASELDDRPGLTVAPPEGFSYYALHPQAIADRVAQPPFTAMRNVAILGLRSIGTAMSAVVMAALRSRGARADRTTVRPQGDPYARETRLTPEQAGWVRARASEGADFVVVDEGPGASGSSLLSAASAVLGAGAPRERLVILCTRIPDPDALLAADASTLWPALRVAAIEPGALRPPAGYAAMAPGSWRERFLEAGRPWPATWLWLERAKALADDRRALLKFEGLGRVGAEATARAEALAGAGFGPEASWASAGWVRYAIVPAKPGASASLDSAILDRLAAYCAFRADAFATEAESSPATAALARNGEVAFGRRPEASLQIVRPTVCDASHDAPRMGLPPRWGPRQDRRGNPRRRPPVSRADRHRMGPRGRHLRMAYAPRRRRTFHRTVRRDGRRQPPRTPPGLAPRLRNPASRVGRVRLGQRGRPHRVRAPLRRGRP